MLMSCLAAFFLKKKKTPPSGIRNIDFFFVSDKYSLDLYELKRHHHEALL